jgi:hypothetical protein
VHECGGVYIKEKISGWLSRFRHESMETLPMVLRPTKKPEVCD